MSILLQQVINFPKRSPLDSINTTPLSLPRISTNATPLSNGQPLSPQKPKTPNAGNSARNSGGPAPPQKPEDKESPEYKKKQAMLTGPILPMNYDNAANYGMTESLFTSLKDIFEGIIANQSRTGVVSPAKFLEVLRKENEMFRTSMHQDAHEFLNLLLNEVVADVEANARKIEADKVTDGSAEEGGLEKALATTLLNTTGTRTPSNTGWVHELFEGTLTSETKCLTCENVSQRDEAFLDLSVDLDKHASVTSCLRKFSEEEMLCERNKFHCDRCGGLQEAEKRMKIKRLPKILALHLKRFKYTEDLQRLQKLFHRVVYPYHLRLFNTTDDAEDPDRLYELYAVVVHIGGGPYHGHYVSIVKTQDRGWLLFDDEMVEPVDKNFVRNFFGDRPGLACAYVLFYQETTLEAVKKEQEAEGLAAAAQATAIPKEAVGLGLKTNGLGTNGVQQVQSAVSPVTMDEDGDHWDSLDKAATAPLLSPTKGPATPGMTPIITSPTFQALTPKKSDVQSKKERAREEKERKAAEKEQEKVEKARRKNQTIKNRYDEKKQAADIRAAIEASKMSKVEEDKKLGISSGDAALDDNNNNNNNNHKENGVPSLGTMTSSVGGGFNRFRQSSKSMSKKPKFWGSSSTSSKEPSMSKEDSPSSSAIVEDGQQQHVDGPPAVGVARSMTVGSSHGHAPGAGPEKAEKKNRFSLRKKASTMLL
ncbi:hypothetical protein MMC24_000490 [Lignoscripta atroalba]|nr:hypothetical protein [Lignoscripta atroalba]